MAEEIIRIHRTIFLRIDFKGDTLLQYYLAGRSELSPKQLYAADFDQNGIIDINDVTAI